jgi:hypothetical protein
MMAADRTSALPANAGTTRSKTPPNDSSEPGTTDHAYGRARRLASPGQRLALMARDRGCTFPRCRETASRSEVHHIVDWVKGGVTDIHALALACGYHNNDAILQDWYAIMIGGVPHWVPPPHIDPERKPQRNRVHRG